MQNTAPDLLMLTFIGVLFGFLQRHRSQLYLRFWFAGWVFFYVSYLIWDFFLNVPLSSPVLKGAIQVDTLIASAVVFALAFPATGRPLRRTLYLAAAIVLPVSAVVPYWLSSRFAHNPSKISFLIAAGVLLTESATVFAFNVLLPESWKWHRGLIGLFCALCGASAVSLMQARAGSVDMVDIIYAQYLVMAGVFFFVMYGRRSFIAGIGALGFFSWGLLYLGKWNGHTLIGIEPEYFAYWHLPKYLVGLAVILRIFDDAREEAVYSSQHDGLTGLPNRDLLDERLNQCLARCKRNHTMAALLAIDLDRFKFVNDTYGHDVGDACLQAATERLRLRMRSSDILARIGGDELMAVVDGLHNAAEAEKIATDLLHLFQTPLLLEGCTPAELPMTVSIGIAVFPGDGTDAQTLRTRSDEALYRVKKRGRNGIEVAGKTGAHQTPSPAGL